MIEEENVVEENKETGTHKTTYIQCSEDPDVSIIVGGIEFKEYRHTLRCWSEYFDGAFRSGMKESQNMTFEFPDEDPGEWELIMALTAPLPSLNVTKENLDTALLWFDRLGSKRGLELCDRFILQTVSLLLTEEETSQDPLTVESENVTKMRERSC
jgi:BTB/POZ domain